MLQRRRLAMAGPGSGEQIDVIKILALVAIN
jgi:hypothetical protein